MRLALKVVGIDELAEALGRTPEYIHRNWLKLHTQHGMPRKNPAAWVWPRGAMEAWLCGADAVEVKGLTGLVANQNEMMRLRYSEGRA